MPRRKRRSTGTIPQKRQKNSTSKVVVEETAETKRNAVIEAGFAARPLLRRLTAEQFFGMKSLRISPITPILCCRNESLPEELKASHHIAVSIRTENEYTDGGSVALAMEEVKRVELKSIDCFAPVWSDTIRRCCECRQNLTGRRWFSIARCWACRLPADRDWSHHANFFYDILLQGGLASRINGPITCSKQTLLEFGLYYFYPKTDILTSRFNGLYDPVVFVATLPVEAWIEIPESLPKLIDGTKECQFLDALFTRHKDYQQATLLKRTILLDTLSTIPVVIVDLICSHAWFWALPPTTTTTH